VWKTCFKLAFAAPNTSTVLEGTYSEDMVQGAVSAKLRDNNESGGAQQYVVRNIELKNSHRTRSVKRSFKYAPSERADAVQHYSWLICSLCKSSCSCPT
jgi:hypothetical protein